MGSKESSVLAYCFTNYQNIPLLLSEVSFCDSNNINTYFYLNQFNGIGQYTLANSPSYAVYAYFSKTINYFVKYSTNLNNTGIVEITEFDSV